MRTQPTLFDSLLKMMKPSIPQSPGAPAEGMPSHPQVGIFANLFATAADKKDRDDPWREDGENIRGGMQLLAERLDRIEALLARLLQQRTVKEWYAIAEAAEILGKAEFTVRDRCVSPSSASFRAAARSDLRGRGPQYGHAASPSVGRRYGPRR